MAQTAKQGRKTRTTAPASSAVTALLAIYRSKRDFTKTGEPSGATSPASGNGFVVQKHKASRLHYDLRLELDGVLKSWAVTRGPSPNPDDKRLAVRTGVHPLDYAASEGVVPKGKYGGGTMMLWEYKPLDGLSRWVAVGAGGKG